MLMWWLLSFVVLVYLSKPVKTETESLSPSPSPSISNYQCANATECDELCAKRTKLFEEEYSYGWAIRHPTIGHFYRAVGCSVCVEIGVARGELARYLIKNVPTITEYHGVDPFLGGYDKSDSISNYLEKENASVTWSRAVQNVLKPYGCKFRLHYGLSTDRYVDFPMNSIDCIFIDGDHTFNGVKADIEKYSPALKPGGHYFFDDVSYAFPGTTKAVDLFVERNNLTIKQINKHNNYMVQKPTIEEKKTLRFDWE